MALPNKPLGELPAVVNPEVVEHDTDVLIVGGGMALADVLLRSKNGHLLT
jgi:hypothetical protein